MRRKSKEPVPDVDRLTQGMREFLATAPGCLLCSGPLELCGAFFPNKETSREMRVPVNRQRVFYYGLCAECLRLPNKELLVEEVIFMRQPSTPVVDCGTGEPISPEELN